jgi:hypothetical protein
MNRAWRTDMRHSCRKFGLVVLRFRFLPHTRLLLLLFGVATPSFACSCVHIGPACEDAWLRADAVFVGRVYGSVLLPTKRDNIDTYHRLVRVKVLEPFIGATSGWTTVETGVGGGDCGYDFSWGEKYVIYAHRNKDGSLSTSICTRTQKVSDASVDLAYLRTLKDLPATGRVYGTVNQYTFDPNFKAIEVSLMSPYGGPEEQVMSMRALTGTILNLEGSSGKQIARAGQNGEFAFEHLTPGQYKISADLPKVMKPWDRRDIQVPAKGCSEISIRTAFNGRLSGRVSNEAGEPLPYMAVEVIRASDVGQAERAFQWVNADKNGAFEIGPLPPDEYVVGVNVVKYSGARQHPKTYYPGTSNEQEAKRIRISEGQLVQGLDFKLKVRAAAQR